MSVTRGTVVADSGSFSITVPALESFLESDAIDTHGMSTLIVEPLDGFSSSAVAVQGLGANGGASFLSAFDLTSPTLTAVGYMWHGGPWAINIAGWAAVRLVTGAINGGPYTYRVTATNQVIGYQVAQLAEATFANNDLWVHDRLVSTALAAVTDVNKIRINDVGALTCVSGTASGSGDNIVVSPSDPGNTLRVYYLSYNPASPVTAAFRFGAGGLFLKNNIAVGGSIIAKDFGDRRYTEGAPGENLILNLSGAVSTIWNAFYREV